MERSERGDQQQEETKLDSVLNTVGALSAATVLGSVGVASGVALGACFGIGSFMLSSATIAVGSMVTGGMFLLAPGILGIALAGSTYERLTIAAHQAEFEREFGPINKQEE